MGRDRRKEVWGPENSATSTNHDFGPSGLSPLAMPPNSEKRPRVECSIKQARFTQKNGGNIKFF